MSSPSKTRLPVPASLETSEIAGATFDAASQRMESLMGMGLFTAGAGTVVSVREMALACVTCNSATACQVRRAIFDHHFLHTFALIVMPFPILLAAAAMVYLAFPIPRGEQA